MPVNKIFIHTIHIFPEDSSQISDLVFPNQYFLRTLD